jgi:hypothetical protein
VPARWRHAGLPPLPAYVTRPALSVATGDKEPVVWHEQLSWVAEASDLSILRPGELRFLAQVNRWLPHRRGTVVPLRERSLEVFGDEKALERRMLGPLFEPGRLSFELLECEPC